MILVSACLLGINCKYNGDNNKDEKVIKLKESNFLIPVCPEQLGGLETPRQPSEIEIINNEEIVITKNGKDVTEKFIKGAVETLKIANLYNAKVAILKSRSPSCGSKNIYDGKFSGALIKGKGITAKLLEENKITVFNEENYIDKLK